MQKLWDHEIRNETNLTDVVYSGAAPGPLNNTLFVYAAGANPLSNDNTTQPTKLLCQLWNTSYVVDLNFTNGVRALTPISTTLVATIPPHDPAVNGGYYVTHMLFSGLIQRTLVNSASGSLGDFLPSGLLFSMSIMQTGLFSCPELWNSSNHETIRILGNQSTTQCRNKTLARALEDLSHNFTYSLLSLNAANTSVPVVVSLPQNFYSYNRRNLLSAYMTALGVTIACVIVGFLALRENGVSQGTSFSSVLTTTRKPELD